MSLNTSNDFLVERRREFVAGCRERNYSIRQIVIALEAQRDTATGAPIFRNPKTGQPYGKSTVERDLKAIMEEWRTRYTRSFEDHVATQIAKLESLEREGWKLGGVSGLELVRRSLDDQRRLLGLDKPRKLEHAGPGGGPIPLAGMSKEEADQLIRGLYPEYSPPVDDPLDKNEDKATADADEE